LLVAPRRTLGLSGSVEARAFHYLPQVSVSVTRRLVSLAEQEILPAARDASVEAFGEGVYEYGRQSGECFAAVQSGPYASAEIAQLVAALREWGVRGVGQSSWGPTVFALVEGDAAVDLAARLRGDRRFSDHVIKVAAPDNRGATVRVRAASSPRDYSNP
jgi:predicted sugar kinase